MTEMIFLNELREKTAPMHKALEQTEISQQIISPSLTKEQYQSYLQKMLSIHRSVEANAFPLLVELIPDIADRSKTNAIASDLKNLASAEKANNVAFIDEQFVASASFCFGMMYVTEGSTLGGMYILKNVAAVMGEETKDVTHFFNCYGQATGSKWKAFLSAFDKYSASASDKQKDEIIAGAIYGFKRTFEVFKA